jgi:hypothetical protein
MYKYFECLSANQDSQRVLRKEDIHNRLGHQILS